MTLSRAVRNTFLVITAWTVLLGSVALLIREVSHHPPYYEMRGGDPL